MHVDKRRLIEVDILYYAIQINSILRLHLNILFTTCFFTSLYNTQLASSQSIQYPTTSVYVHGPSPIKGREAILRTHDDPPSAS